MELASLLAHVGFEVEEEPLEKVAESLDKIKERLDFIIGVEAVTRLYEMSERFSEWGAQLNITAQNLGITTEALQGLTFAAGDFGVSQQMMSESLAHLSRSLYEAKNGSIEMQTHFAQAGFTGTALQNFKTSEDALLAIADKLKSIDDPMRRMAVAQELLGRGGFRMVAFLKQGSGAIKEQREELRKLGLELSGPQVQALVQVDSTFHKLHAILAAIGAQIASYVAPAFTFLVDKFIALYSASKSLIDAGTTTWLDTLLYGLGFVSGVVYSLIGRFSGLGKSIRDAFNQGGLSGVVEMLEKEIAAFFNDERISKWATKIAAAMSSPEFQKALQAGLDMAFNVGKAAYNIGMLIAGGFIVGVGEWMSKKFLGDDVADKTAPKMVTPQEAAGPDSPAESFFRSLLEATIGAPPVGPVAQGVHGSEPFPGRKIISVSHPEVSTPPLATTAQAALGSSVNKTANTVVSAPRSVQATTHLTVVTPSGVAATPEQIQRHAEKATKKTIDELTRQLNHDLPNAEKP